MTNLSVDMLLGGLSVAVGALLIAVMTMWYGKHRLRRQIDDLEAECERLYRQEKKS